VGIPQLFAGFPSVVRKSEGFSTTRLFHSQAVLMLA
jgi:hypothetical protein